MGRVEATGKKRTPFPAFFVIHLSMSRQSQHAFQSGTYQAIKMLTAHSVSVGSSTFPKA